MMSPNVVKKMGFFGKFSMVTYGVVWHDFCTIKFLERMAMHVQMCKSFLNKILWRLKVNFPFIL
jgi:hypothetical protein